MGDNGFFGATVTPVIKRLYGDKHAAERLIGIGRKLHGQMVDNNIYGNENIYAQITTPTGVVYKVSRVQGIDQIQIYVPLGGEELMVIPNDVIIGFIAVLNFLPIDGRSIIQPTFYAAEPNRVEIESRHLIIGMDQGEPTPQGDEFFDGYDSDGIYNLEPGEYEFNGVPTDNILDTQRIFTADERTWNEVVINDQGDATDEQIQETLDFWQSTEWSEDYLGVTAINKLESGMFGFASDHRVEDGLYNIQEFTALENVFTEPKHATIIALPWALDFRYAPEMEKKSLTFDNPGFGIPGTTADLDLIITNIVHHHEWKHRAVVKDGRYLLFPIGRLNSPSDYPDFFVTVDLTLFTREGLTYDRNYTINLNLGDPVNKIFIDVGIEFEDEDIDPLVGLIETSKEEIAAEDLRF